MPSPRLLLCIAFGLLTASSSARALFLGECNDGNATAHWIYNEQDGTLRPLAANGSASSLCVTAMASMLHPVSNGSGTRLTACQSGDREQAWTLIKENNTIVLRDHPDYCINVKDYQKTAGSVVWMWVCNSQDCQGNCDWSWQNNSLLVNSASNLCLVDLPPRPRTCDEGAPGANHKFCDASLSVDDRVASLSLELTLDEKVAQIGSGVSAPAIDRLGISAHWWDQTCIHGVADDYDMHGYNRQRSIGSYVTIYPHSIGQAASFNITLARAIAKATADEARALGEMHYQQSGQSEIWCRICNGGPLANLVHDPRWGRTSETYGEDPHVISRFAAQYTDALQNFDKSNKYVQTISVIRHISVFSGPDNEGTFSSNISVRDLEDSILPGFQATVLDGNALGMMCDYGAINGTPGCANKAILTGRLREGWKFQGYVIDDAGAVNEVWRTHHYVNTSKEAVAVSVKAGTNLMYEGGHVSDYQAGLQDGSISEDEVNENFHVVFRTRMWLGEFDPVDGNPYASIPLAVLNSLEHQALARDAARQSIVLLENVDDILPLRFDKDGRFPHLAPQAPVHKIAVIGPTANASIEQYTHSYAGLPPYVVTPLQGTQSAVSQISPNTSVSYAMGCDIASTSTTGFEEAISLAKQSDLIIFCGGLSALVSREGLDRQVLDLPGVQPDLLSQLSSLQKPLVVVMVNGAGVSINTTGVDAVVESWYGGQEAGNGLADVLFGHYNPGGRLPLTFYDRSTQLPDIASYDFAKSPGRTYRYFSGTPQWAFGYGLSYTSFAYKNITVNSEGQEAYHPCGNYTVTAVVSNIGKMDGSEVVQLYVTVPTVSDYPTPRYSLQGFERVFIKAGSTSEVLFTLQSYQLSSVTNLGFRLVPPGTYKLYVGGNNPADKKAPAFSRSASLNLQVEATGGYAIIDDLRRCHYTEKLPNP